jgi:hypothetical protein
VDSRQTAISLMSINAMLLLHEQQPSLCCVGRIGSSAPCHSYVPVDLRVGNYQAAQARAMVPLGNHLRGQSDPYARNDEFHD